MCIDEVEWCFWDCCCLCDVVCVEVALVVVGVVQVCYCVGVECCVDVDVDDAVGWVDLFGYCAHRFVGFAVGV